MRHPFRVLLLAVALAATPACAGLQHTQIIAPPALDQHAYGLVQGYAALLEEAADVIADPATPPALRDAMARSERLATPAVEMLAAAAGVHARARADFEAAASAADELAQRRAASALQSAARRLSEAEANALAPVSELQMLLEAGGPR